MLSGGLSLYLLTENQALNSIKIENFYSLTEIGILLPSILNFQEISKYLFKTLLHH